MVEKVEPKFPKRKTKKKAHNIPERGVITLWGMSDSDQKRLEELLRESGVSYTESYRPDFDNNVTYQSFSFAISFAELQMLPNGAHKIIKKYLKKEV